MPRRATMRFRRPKAPERGAKLLDTNSGRDRFLWLVEGGQYIVADVGGGTLLISNAHTMPQLFANKDGAV